MIFVLTRADNDYGFDGMETWEPDLADRIRMVHYEKAFSENRLPLGTYLFTDLERLSKEETAAALALWEQLSEAGARCKNRPDYILSRYELLRRMHQSGGNEFAVYRAKDAGGVERFPVFVRRAREHQGSMTNLIDSPKELAAALRRLRLQGNRLEDLLIVEFCDTSVDGQFRKFAVVKIGDQLVTRHLSYDRHFVVKTRPREEIVVPPGEEEEWFATNPEQQWIREVFDVARVDFGRIDYGMLGTRPQVWEINTAPVLFGSKRIWEDIRREGGWLGELITPERLAMYERVAFNMRLAFEELDRDSPEGEAHIAIPQTLTTKAALATKRRDRRERAVARYRRVGSAVKKLVR